MGGLPCIGDLRVTVGMILGQLAAGQTKEQVLADYPYLEDDDIAAALAFAAARRESTPKIGPLLRSWTPTADRSSGRRLRSARAQTAIASSGAMRLARHAGQAAAATPDTAARTPSTASEVMGSEMANCPSARAENTA